MLTVRWISNSDTVLARRFAISSSLLLQHHQHTPSPPFPVVHLHISVSPRAKLALRISTQRGSSISTRRFGQRHNRTTSHHLIRLHGKIRLAKSPCISSPSQRIVVGFLGASDGQACLHNLTIRHAQVLPLQVKRPPPPSLSNLTFLPFPQAPHLTARTLCWISIPHLPNGTRRPAILQTSRYHGLTATQTRPRRPRRPLTPNYRPMKSWVKRSASRVIRNRDGPQRPCYLSMARISGVFWVTTRPALS